MRRGISAVVLQIERANLVHGENMKLHKPLYSKTALIKAA